MASYQSDPPLRLLKHARAELEELMAHMDRKDQAGEYACVQVFPILRNPTDAAEKGEAVPALTPKERGQLQEGLSVLLQHRNAPRERLGWWEWFPWWRRRGYPAIAALYDYLSRGDQATLPESSGASAGGGSGP